MPHFIRIFALAMILAVFGNSLSAQVTNEDAIRSWHWMPSWTHEATNRISVVDALNANRERSGGARQMGV